MVASAAIAIASEASESGGSDEQGGRRRGRRGGRGRGERRSEAENSTETPVEAIETVVVPVEVAPTVVPAETPAAAIALVSEPVVQATEPAPAIMETIAQIAEPVVALAAVETPVIESVSPQIPFPEPAVIVPEAEEMPVVPVAVQVAAPVDLGKTLSESGLILVQTTAAAVVAQPEPPVKLGRQRKPKTVEAAEEVSLVMVETQK